jgi:hypothetical protein
MSRKALAIIVIFVIILLGLLGGFYYYLKTQASTTPGSPSKGLSLRDFFPFGKAPATTPGATPTPQNSGTSTQNNPVQENIVATANPSVPVLRHITGTPIAGAVIFDRTTGTSTKKTTVNAIRYMDRATGNVFEAATNTLSVLRVSNTTFPKAYEAFFDNSGESMVLRTLKNDDGEAISTYFGHLHKETPTSTEEKLDTTLISNNADFISLSPTKSKLFSIGSEGGEKGIVSNLDGSNKTIVWTSQLREWLPNWVTADTILLSSKPSADVIGSSYLLNVSTKSFRKTGSSLPGLAVSASPNLSYLIYAQSDTENLSLIFGLMDKTGKTPAPLSLKTLPEKCVWSQKDTAVIFCAVPDFIPKATYPDDWYMGKMSFSDSIWKLNLATGENRQIASLRELSKSDIDGINLSLDSKEDYLLFTNKIDLTLWGLQIKN